MKKKLEKTFLIRKNIPVFLSIVILLLCMSAFAAWVLTLRISVVEVRKGYFYVNQKKDAGKYDMVHASFCGCCGSDFSDWLYVPKSFNFTVGCSYHITVYGEYIVDFEG